MLTLTRWRPDLPPTASNLVLMMQDQAEKLVSQGKHAAFSSEVVRKIEQRLLWAASVMSEEEGRATEPTSGRRTSWNRYFVQGLLFGAAATYAIQLLRSSGIATESLPKYRT